MRKILRRNAHQGLLGLLLLAFFVRALIPAGYMPAADFSFQICPDGFPAHLLKISADAHAGHAHHHDAADAHADHSGHGSHGGHADHGTSHHPSNDDGDAPRLSSASAGECAFAAAGGPALFAFIATFAADVAAPAGTETLYRGPHVENLRVRTPQARGPPTLS